MDRDPAGVPGGLSPADPVTPTSPPDHGGTFGIFFRSDGLLEVKESEPRRGPPTFQDAIHNTTVQDLTRSRFAPERISFLFCFVFFSSLKPPLSTESSERIAGRPRVQGDACQALGRQEVGAPPRGVWVLWESGRVGARLCAQPGVLQALGGRGPALGLQLQHGQQEVAELGGLVQGPLVLLQQNLKEAPRLQVGDVPQLT